MLKPYIDHLIDMPSYKCGFDPKKDVSLYDEVVDTLSATEVGDCDECPGIDMLAVSSINGLEAYVENLDGAQHIPDQEEYIQYLFDTLEDDDEERPDYVDEYIADCREKGVAITIELLKMCIVKHYESGMEEAETTIDSALRGLRTVSTCLGPLTGSVCLADGTNTRNVRVCGASHFKVSRIEAGPIIVESAEESTDSSS